MKLCNPFGLIGDLDKVKLKIEKNVKKASGIIHNLRMITEADEIQKIGKDNLVLFLKQVQDLLDEIST